jgi:hypothetical protein
MTLSRFLIILLLQNFIKNQPYHFDKSFEEGCGEKLSSKSFSPARIILHNSKSAQPQPRTFMYVG